jgi:hypothetical protein
MPIYRKHLSLLLSVRLNVFSFIWKAPVSWSVSVRSTLLRLALFQRRTLQMCRGLNREIVLFADTDGRLRLYSADLNRYSP